MKSLLSLSRCQPIVSFFSVKHVLLLLLLDLLPLHLQAEPASIADIIDHLATTSKSRISEKKLANKSLVIKAYTQNNYQPLWPNNYINKGIQVLGLASEDGLLKKDYHYFRLMELTHLYNKTGYDKRKIRAELDILLTDGILSYQLHLMNGKVSPHHLYRNWNYMDVNESAPSLISKLKRSINRRSLEEDTIALRPQFQWYKRLQHQLKRYERLAVKYDDDKVVLHHIIRPGESDASIRKVKEKLHQQGVLNSYSNNDSRYDPITATAVKKFQELNGLKPDGVIGPETVRHLNMSFREKADKIKANLERARWIADELSDDYLLVNIAGYKLTYVQDKKKEWSTEVIVGTQAHKTPVFTAKLKYIEFNPTWTVPKSMLPNIVRHAKNNPAYLRDRGYVIHNNNGSIVSPSSINWASVDPYNFRYWLVREPSNMNPLGRVKFMFPNSHAIYMHDTPSKHLFSKETRNLSHGCIRVKDPFELSLMLLGKDQGFSEYRQNEIRDSGKRTQVVLKQPIDVFIMYWTVTPEKDGLHFYQDAYNRDPKLIALLKKPMEEILAAEKKSFHTSIQ